MNQRSRFVSCSALLVLLGLAGSCGHRVEDSRIVSDLQKRLLKESSLNGYDVHVNAQNGAVILTGVVGSEQDKAKVEMLASSYAGVSSVADSLKVISLSSDDNAIAKAIQSSFASQPELAKEQLSVACSNGVVTLTGSVSSAVAYSQAETLAKQVKGVQSIVNQVQVKAPPATVEEAKGMPPAPPSLPEAQARPPETKPASTQELAAAKPTPAIPPKSTPVPKPVPIEKPALPVVAKASLPEKAASAPASKAAQPKAETHQPERAAAPTVELQISPSAIAPGQSVTLTWHSQNAVKLELKPGIGEVKPSGSKVVRPNGSTEYTLLAKGPAGSATSTATVHVSTPAAAPTISAAAPAVVAPTAAAQAASAPPEVVPTAKLTASKPSIRQGESVTLTWSSKDATVATVEPGPGDVETNGSTTVTPQHTTEYHLIARGPGGAGRATVKVVVREPFPVTIPAGTTFTISLKEKVDEHTQTNQKLAAFVASPVFAEGWEAIPRDTPAQVFVVEMKKAGRMSGESRVKLSLNEIAVGDRKYPVSSSVFEKAGPARDSGAFMDSNMLQVRLALGSIVRFQLTSPVTVIANP
ncbi:MAG: BON domain-containing protein [Terriglobales bacterium]